MSNTVARTDSYVYTAFGQVRGRTGTSEQPFGYVGNAFDPKTGLSDFHACACFPKMLAEFMGALKRILTKSETSQR